jgi:hypothetical protein
MSSADTGTSGDEDWVVVLHIESTKDSQASTRAQQARLFVTRPKRLPTDDWYEKSSDMYTATSSETRGTVVFTELQGDEYLLEVRWDPFQSGDKGFLEAFNRCLKAEHTDDDLRRYTMIAAPSGLTLWKKDVQTKYGSINIVFDEGIRQALTVAEVEAKYKPPYDLNVGNTDARAVGYVLEPFGQSEWRFVCWVLEEF